MNLDKAVYVLALASQVIDNRTHRLGYPEDVLVQICRHTAVLGDKLLHSPHQERFPNATVPVNGEHEAPLRVGRRQRQIRTEPGDRLVAANEASL